jgi:tetratricopeptide (TPR) repeat protein
MAILVLSIVFSAAHGFAQQRQSTSEALTIAKRAHRLASSATTLDEFTESLRVCKQSLAANPTAKTRVYVEQLASWIYNKRGEQLVQLAEDIVEQDAQRAAKYERAATGDFDLAVRLDKTNWQSRYNRAVSVAVLGKYQQALDDLDFVIQERPRHKNARFNRAEILFQLGKFQQAVDFYSQAIELDPRDAAAHSGRGLAYLELGDFDKALLDLNTVLRLDSDNPEAYVDRADLYATIGNWERAAGDYRVAIGLNNQLPGAYQNVAWLMATCPDKRFRNASKAIRAANKAIELGGSDYRRLDTLAAALASAGHFAQATATVKKAISSAPAEEVTDLVARRALYQSHRPFRDALDSQVRLASAEDTE